MNDLEKDMEILRLKNEIESLKMEIINLKLQAISDKLELISENNKRAMTKFVRGWQYDR